MKNLLHLKDDWENKKEKLKEKYPILNDSDIIWEDGMNDDLMNRLQIKLVRTKDEIFKILESV